VALGTDGMDGDLLAEARAYALHPRVRASGAHRDVGVRIAAGQRLAAALFGDAEPARIVPGARADLAILDYDPLTPMTSSNLVEHASRGWSAGHVRHTIASGRFILKDRVLTGIDERALAARSRLAASALWERIQGYG
jgi:cytosine/adenosine deaminase-related metal-dependent hydrolase